MKFYKIRAFVLMTLTRFLGRILTVEVPPILSAGAIIERGDKILVLDHTYIKGYGLPGGLVKAGEDIESALKREVKEETGLDIVSARYFTSTSGTYRNLPTISLTFLIQVSGFEKESSEGKLLWLPATEAVKNMAYPGAEIALNKYIKRGL